MRGHGRGNQQMGAGREISGLKWRLKWRRPLRRDKPCIKRCIKRYSRPARGVVLVRSCFGSRSRARFKQLWHGDELAALEDGHATHGSGASKGDRATVCACGCARCDVQGAEGARALSRGKHRQCARSDDRFPELWLRLPVSATIGLFC